LGGGRTFTIFFPCFLCGGGRGERGDDIKGGDMGKKRGVVQQPCTIVPHVCQERGKKRKSALGIRARGKKRKMRPIPPSSLLFEMRGKKRGEPRHGRGVGGEREGGRLRSNSVLSKPRKKEKEEERKAQKDLRGEKKKGTPLRSGRLGPLSGGRKERGVKPGG